MVSIYLISRSIELTPSTYDQRSIHYRKVRRNIAHLILQKNELPPGATSLPPRAPGSISGKSASSRSVSGYTGRSGKSATEFDLRSVAETTVDFGARR